MSAIVEPPTLRTELSATVRLAAPLSAAAFLQMAVHAIDVIFVARLGPEALAATSLGIAYYWLISYGLTGLISAVAPFISAELGRRSNPVREVRRSMRMSFWVSLAGGVVGVALALVSEPFFLLTGQDPYIAKRAADFLAITSFSLFPMLLITALRIFVSVMGRPIFATVITGFAIAVNALGNYALIFGNFGAPAMGLEGAALATVITSVITVLVYVLAIHGNRRMRRYYIFGRWWRPEWRRLQDIIRIGTPIGLTLMAEGGLFSGAAFIMGRIGASELAAHTIALQIASFTFQIAYGISQAATIRVGLFFGGLNHAGIARAGRAALLVAFSFSSGAAVLFFTAPGLLLSVYIDIAAPENASLVVLTTQYIFIAAAFQVFDTVQAVTAGLLRGLQDTRIPMYFAVGAYWLIGFSISAWLGLGTALGGVGVWIGLAISLVVAAFLLLVRWVRRGQYNLLPATAQR